MIKKITIWVFALLPSIAFAQTTTFQTILETIREILDFLIPLLITLAIVFFFWGLAQFILSAGDSGAQDAGRSKMLWGVIALFVIVSVWGLVAVIQNTFDIDENNAQTQGVEGFPTVPGGTTGGGGSGTAPPL